MNYVIVDFYAINTYIHRLNKEQKIKNTFEFWKDFRNLFGDKQILIFGKGNNSEKLKSYFKDLNILFIQSDLFCIGLYQFLKENGNFKYYLLTEDVTALDTILLLLSKNLKINLSFYDIGSFSSHYLSTCFKNLFEDNFEYINIFPKDKLDKRIHLVELRRHPKSLLTILEKINKANEDKQIILAYEWLDKYRVKLEKILDLKYSLYYLIQNQLLRTDILYPIGFRRFKSGYKETFYILKQLFKLHYPNKKIKTIKDLNKRKKHENHTNSIKTYDL